jgi:peptide/nickel transport system permease protein
MLSIIWLATTLSFLALHLLPGSPIERILGISYYRKEVVYTLQSKYQLNRSIFLKYIDFIKKFFTGNWGESTINHRKVSLELKKRLPISLILILFSFIASSILTFFSSLLMKLFL